MMTHFWVLETPSELWSIQIQYLFKGAAAAACPGKSLNHFSLETIVQTRNEEDLKELEGKSRWPLNETQEVSILEH